MSIALITGSAGLVGSEASLFFLDKGFDVIGIDNNERRKLFGIDGDTIRIREKIKKYSKRYSHYDYDIVNSFQIERLFKKFNKKIKVIIHAAAQPSHDWAYKDPKKDFKINSLGTLNFLELNKKYCPDAIFIFTSTNKVYGDNPNNLNFIENKYRWELLKSNKYFKGIDENFSIDKCTHSLFGASKLYADILVQEYGRNFGLRTVAFRAGCITGPNHSGAKLHGFLSYLVKSCVRERKYDLIGYKGKQVRDNIHSYDLINCFWEFFKKPRSGEVYNIGGGRKSNCSILEAINIVENKIGKDVKKVFHKNPRVGDHKWYISNIKKFNDHYPNFKQKYNTSIIIDELLESFI
jgi:CDP-paratose 2-epimerase